MRKHGILWTVILAVGLLTVAGAGPGPEEREPTLSPMMTEIQAVLDRQDASLTDLQSRLKTAPAERDALALLRQVDRVKRDAEVDILKIQRRYALEAEDLEAVARIDASIGQLTNPIPARPQPDVEKRRLERQTGGQSRD